MNTTSISLLERLRQPEAAGAWSRFVDLYTPLLYYWAKRLGLQQADAADLVQDILVTLVRQMPTFTYKEGKRFRGWLWTVTINKLREKHRSGDTAAAAARETTRLPRSMPDQAEAVSEAEYRTYLVQRVLELMQAEFRPQTWKACWEFVVAERDAADIAADLGITVNAVYLAKSRVLRRARQELAGLLE